MMDNCIYKNTDTGCEYNDRPISVIVGRSGYRQEFTSKDGFQYLVIYGPIMPGQVHLINFQSNVFALVKFSKINKPPFQYESYRIIATDNPILNAFGFSSIDVLEESMMCNDKIVRRGLKDMYDIVPHNIKGF